MDGDDYSSNSSNEIAENAWSRFFSTLKSRKNLKFNSFLTIQ